MSIEDGLMMIWLIYIAAIGIVWVVVRLSGVIRHRRWLKQYTKDCLENYLFERPPDDKLA